VAVNVLPPQAQHEPLDAADLHGQVAQAQPSFPVEGHTQEALAFELQPQPVCLLHAHSFKFPALQGVQAHAREEPLARITSGQPQAGMMRILLSLLGRN